MYSWYIWIPKKKVWYKHSPYPWVSWQACFSPKYLFQTNQHGEDVFFHIFQDYSQKGNVETKQESSITCSRPGIIAIWTHSRIQILSTPPRGRYGFKVELMTSVQKQASRVIPVSPAKNELLDKMNNEGPSISTIQQTISCWDTMVLFTGNKQGSRFSLNIKAWMLWWLGITTCHLNNFLDAK